MGIHDELLLLRCRRGDAGAFAQLVDRWNARLFRHARRLTGEQESAWDVVQETWLAIIKGLSGLDDVRAFATWAFRIVHHKCADRSRKEKRRRRLGKELADRPRDCTGARATAQARTGLLEEGIDALPPEQRSAVSLYYLEGLSVGEIAKIESVPEGTVKSRLYHARQSLRAYLEEREDGQRGT